MKPNKQRKPRSLTVTSRLRVHGFTKKEISCYNKRLNRINVKFSDIKSITTVISERSYVRFETNFKDGMVIEYPLINVEEQEGGN